MIVEEIKINTENTNRTVKELRQELKDLKDQLLNCEQGTEEYNKTLQDAANIQRELKDQMQLVNNSAQDFGQIMGNCTSVMAGVSGAITAATGALSLFGIENDEAQKKITATMTALIGITQGLSKIDNGIKAFKRLTIAINAGSKSLNGFKIALISTGLGALVVVLGSIIAYWDEFTEAIGLSSEQLERLGDIAKGVFNVLSSGMKGVAQALGKMLKGDFSGAWESLKQGFNVVDNFNAGVEKSIADREEKNTKKAQEEAAKRAKIAEEEYQKRIKAAQKLAAWERDMEAAKTRGADSDKYTQAAFDRQMKYFDALFAVYRKDSDEYKQLVLEKEQYLQDWDNHLLEQEETEKEIMARKIKYEKELEEAKTRGEEKYSKESYDRQMKYFDDLFALYDEESDKYKQLVLEKEQYLQDWDKHLADITQQEKEKTDAESEERQRILDQFNEELQTEQEKLDVRYQMLIDAAEKEGQATTAIKEWYEKEKTRIVKEEEEKQTAIRKASLKAYGTIANSVGDILTSMSEMMEEGSEEQKGIQTASAIIATLVGMMQAIQGGNAMASQMGLAAPVGWALGAAQAAATLAAGIATIANINKAKDGGGLSSSSAPSVNIVSAVAASPDFTQTIDGAMTTTAIQDQKVYVTEHDITETQKKVEVNQANATY